MAPDPTHPAPPRTLGDWLAAAPFTLTLSSGFFGFFAHAGMLQALVAAGLAPARVTGASAGALVGSGYAAGLTPAQLVHELLALRRADFWDPGLGLGLLRGRLFRTRLERLLPVQEFAATRLPLALSVYQWHGRQTRALASGALVPAVYASCAVPLLFQPLRIDGFLCSDGGIADRWGLAGTAPGERVFYHHIGSRSPWRRAGDPGLAIPPRDNFAALELFHLPRSGPAKLHLGADIVALAQRATARALVLPAGTPDAAFRSLARP